MENPLSREIFVETHRVLTTLAFASYMLLAAQVQFAPNGDLFADTVSEMFKTRLADIVETKLPWLFLIYTVPSIIGLSIIMPPFQVADERAHTERADQLGRGRMISHRLGGTIDGGWVMIGSLYENMWFHLEVKQTVDLAHEAGSIRWSGPKSKVNFPEHREIRSVSLRTPCDRLVARPSVRYPPRPDGGSSAGDQRLGGLCHWLPRTLDMSLWEGADLSRHSYCR